MYVQRVASVYGSCLYAPRLTLDILMSSLAYQISHLSLHPYNLYALGALH